MSRATSIRSIRAPPRVGQPRPADGRGRGDAATTARSAARSRRPARRKGTREALELRDGGAALRRARRDARGRPRQRRDRARAASACRPTTRRRSTARLIELDGTPDEDAPRRQRDAGGVDGGGARRGGVAAACRCTSTSAAPTRRCCRCRRSRSSAAARTPAAASTSRTSWSSAPARASFAQALEWTAEVYRAAGVADAASAARASASPTRAAGGPTSRTNEQALETLVAGDRARRLRARRAGRDRARHRRLRVRPRRPLHARPRVARARFRRHDRAAAALDRQVPDRLDRGSARRGRRRRLRPLHPGGRRRGCRSSATTSWCPMRRSCARRPRAGAANTVLLKPNQRGTLTETLDAWRAAQAARLRRHRLGALGRDRGHDHRPPRDRLGRRPAQGRLVRARRAHGEVERGAAHRGAARCAGALRRRGRVRPQRR